MAFEISKLETLYEGWAKFLIATVRREDGQTMRREIEDHGRAACVLPYDAERKTAILISQFRAPVLLASGDAAFLEAVAGIVEESEKAAETARREAEEEAGLRLATLEPVATLWTMPGISTEQMDLFLAPYRAADRLGDGGGLAREHEDIAVREIALGELAEMADGGRLNDLKTFALVQSLRLRRPELFA